MLALLNFIYNVMKDYIPLKNKTKKKHIVYFKVTTLRSHRALENDSGAETRILE